MKSQMIWTGTLAALSFMGSVQLANAAPAVHNGASSYGSPSLLLKVHGDDDYGRDRGREGWGWRSHHRDDRDRRGWWWRHRWERDHDRRFERRSDYGYDRRGDDRRW